MKTLFLALGLGACLTGCSLHGSQIPSYKLTVVQGNQLDARALAQLQPGMSRQQVQGLLGTPLLQDPFHANRWDYTFLVTHNQKIRKERHLTVLFNGDALASVTGDALDYARKELDTAPVAPSQLPNGGEVTPAPARLPAEPIHANPSLY